MKKKLINKRADTISRRTLFNVTHTMYLRKICQIMTIRHLLICML